ncbi:MAG: hypothetical protein ACT4PP_09720 [Sporichthyaceae bacterium]
MTRTPALALAALGVAALAVPLTAGGAFAAHQGNAVAADHDENTLRVCISGLKNNDAEIEVRGEGISRSKDNDGGCTSFRNLENGTYRVEISTPRRCDDARGKFRIRGGGTFTIRFDADCSGRDRDDDFDEDDFYVTTREQCKDNGDDVVRTLRERRDRDDDVVLCRED